MGNRILAEFYTEEEVAEALGLSPATLMNRRYAGKDHPPYIKVGNRVMYRKTQFWSWIEAREKAAKSSKAS